MVDRAAAGPPAITPLLHSLLPGRARFNFLHGIYMIPAIVRFARTVLS